MYRPGHPYFLFGNIHEASGDLCFIFRTPLLIGTREYRCKSLFISKIVYSSIRVTHLHVNRMAGLLIERGGDVQARNTKGMTPLHEAAQYDSFRVTKTLLSSSTAELNSKDFFNNTPLHVAAWKDSRRVATVLINKGANINPKGFKGRTPLHYVGFHDSFHIAELFLKTRYDHIHKTTHFLTFFHNKLYSEGLGNFLNPILKSPLAPRLESARTRLTFASV